MNIIKNNGFLLGFLILTSLTASVSAYADSCGAKMRRKAELAESIATNADPIQQNNAGTIYANLCSELMRCNTGHDNAYPCHQDTYDVVALKWYRLAAESDFAPAQYNLALMYELGRGEEKDERKSMRWYKRSAQLGFPPAMEKVGKTSPKEELGAEKLCLSNICIGMSLREVLSVDIDIDQGITTSDPKDGGAALMGLAMVANNFMSFEQLNGLLEDRQREIDSQPPARQILTRIAENDLCEETDILFFFKSESGHRTGVVLRYKDDREPLRVVAIYREYEDLQAGALDNMIDQIIDAFPSHLVAVDPLEPKKQPIYIEKGDKRVKLMMQDVEFQTLSNIEKTRAYTQRQACLNKRPPSIE